MTIYEFLNRLRKVKPQRDGSYLALCPAHADNKTLSLHVTHADGKILLKCFAGCEQEAIANAMNLTMADLFTETKPTESKVKSKLVCTYDYKDEKGDLLYQVCRFEPKDFRPRHRNGDGEWQWNMDGVRRVLYHLPDVLLADTVYLCEGEKDADNLTDCGVLATTSPGGANNWRPEYADSLTGKKVVVMPDKDAAGYTYAKQVCQSLQNKAREVKVVLVPGDNKDFSEWLTMEGDPSAIVKSLPSLEQDISVLSRPVDAPTITATITGYVFKWRDLAATIRRVDVHKAGHVTGDITIETATAKLLPSTQFNFSAGRTRKELANDLATRNKTHDWAAIIQTICDEVQTRARMGEAGQVIEANDDPVIRPRFILEPLVMEGVPSIIYGDKGSKKTSLCLAVLGCIALGWQDNPFGFAVDPKPHSVAFLDWESNWDLTRYNVLRLRKGMGFPYFKFAYRNCGRFPLIDDLEAVQTFLIEHSADVIVIDSLGAACGGDLFKPEPALKFFAALRQLPATTSLIIAQNSKNDDNKKTIFGSTYFSYYARNIFELRKSDTASETELSLGLFHKEGNYSKKYRPIGLRVIDTDDTMTFEPEDLNASQFSDRIKKTLALRDFLSTGEKSIAQIGKHLDLSENATRVMLSKAKKQGKVINLSPGQWGLAQEHLT